MKLFGFWTELPQVLSRIIPKLNSQIVQQTEKVYEMCKKISLTESSIKSLIENVDFSTGSSELKDQVYTRINSIESEKYSICCFSIKLSVNMINSLMKSLDSWENDLITLNKLKILLKLTRSISEKCDEEKNFVTKPNDFEFTKNKCEFIAMIKIFNDKVQTNLFSKSQKFVAESKSTLDAKKADQDKVDYAKLLGEKRQNEKLILKKNLIKSDEDLAEDNRTCENSPRRNNSVSSNNSTIELSLVE